MSKRKYTTELKLQIVEEYQQGELGFNLFVNEFFEFLKVPQNQILKHITSY